MQRTESRKNQKTKKKEVRSSMKSRVIIDINERGYRGVDIAKEVAEIVTDHYGYEQVDVKVETEYNAPKPIKERKESISEYDEDEMKSNEWSRPRVLEPWSKKAENVLGSSKSDTNVSEPRAKKAVRDTGDRVDESGKNPYLTKHPLDEEVEREIKATPKKGYF